MKITMESTGNMMEMNGQPVRLWHGKTERGIDVHVLVAAIAVPSDAPADAHQAFGRELRESDPPTLTWRSWSSRMF